MSQQGTYVVEPRCGGWSFGCPASSPGEAVQKAAASMRSRLSLGEYVWNVTLPNDDKLLVRVVVRPSVQVESMWFALGGP